MVDPRKYWTERAARQGPSYVGPGGREYLSAVQSTEFLDMIEDEFGEAHWPTLLDFGCGSGRLAYELAQYTDAYLGVDISEPGIVQAEEAYGTLSFLWLEEDRIPLEDDSIDLVVAITVFQHIVRDEDFELWTSELRRVLKEGAPVFVIDARFSERPVHAHMRLRAPDELAEALGRKVLTDSQDDAHWVGWIK